jgi:ATP-dependent 26S proteasome regulatory subunit
MGATNRIDILDEALLRPGRFDYLLEVPLPSRSDRKRIFQIHLSKILHSEDIDLDGIVDMTGNMSGSAIMGIVRQCAVSVLERNKYVPTPISQKDLEDTVEKALKAQKKGKDMKERGYHSYIL